MAYVEPPDRATALFITAAIWNQDLAENLRSLFPDGATSVDWDPTLVGVGGGVAQKNDDGAYYTVGAKLHVWHRLEISNPGSGEYYVELPQPAVGITSGQIIGTVFANDASASPNNAVGAVVLTTGSPQQFRFAFPGGNASASHPFVWATDDRLTFFAEYPIA